MSGSISEAKAQLRRQLKEEGARHSAEERQIASAAIRSSVLQWTTPSPPLSRGEEVACL